MSSVAKEVILLADHTKFQQNSPFRMEFNKIDVLITDKLPNKEVLNALDENNIECIILNK